MTTAVMPVIIAIIIIIVMITDDYNQFWHFHDDNVCLQNRGLKINATVQSQYIYCCIGLYRENAIATQKESGDSNGGNV